MAGFTEFESLLFFYLKEEMETTTPRLSDRVASCALLHYNKRLTRKKGKPKQDEWTVFAAIVAYHRTNNILWVVSSATGTKCTAKRHHKGCILHDTHAEVLCRRGFVRVILSEIFEKNNKKEANDNNKTHQKETVDDSVTNFAYSSNLLVQSGCAQQQQQQQQQHQHQNQNQNQKYHQTYKLDPNIEIHLYVSDSPCGDASIYPLDDANTTTNSNNRSSDILFTGAKIIVSNSTRTDATNFGGNNYQLLQVMKSNTSYDGTSKIEKNTSDTESKNNKLSSIATVAREKIQVLGKLRTKSGRSNLPCHMRSNSHCCSDKICTWSILGLQGAFPTKWLNPPIIPLTSIVVSHDSRLKHKKHQLEALERAICSRVQSVLNFLSSQQEGRRKLPPWVPGTPPTVHIASEVFDFGKAQMISDPQKDLSGVKRKQRSSKGKERKEVRQDRIRNSKRSPCGMAINWNQNEDAEVLVGARGILHGKKPKTPEEYEQLASRLSRAKLMQDYYCRDSTANELNIATDDCENQSLIAKYNNSINTNDSSCTLSSKNELSNGTYSQLKKRNASFEWSALKATILTQDGSALVGWLRNTTDNDNFFFTSIMCEKC